jgi:hypothetical protein
MYASAWARNLASLPGEAAISARSIARTWRIAFFGLTQACGLVSTGSLSVRRSVKGVTEAAVSTTRRWGFTLRTGGPRNSSIPRPFAMKRSADAIFRMSPGVRA